MSVSALQASPLAAGLFARAVGMSGTFMPTGGEPLDTLAQAEAKGLKVQAALGAASLVEMRQVPWERVMTAAQQARVRAWPDIDGRLITRDSAWPRGTGRGATRPRGSSRHTGPSSSASSRSSPASSTTSPSPPATPQRTRATSSTGSERWTCGTATRARGPGSRGTTSSPRPCSGCS
jgi:carboxylesterase type B